MDFRVKPQYVTPYTCWEVKLMPRRSFGKPRQSTLQWNSSGLIRDVISGRKMMLLYPLDRLTKEIEHNGERFVPIEKLAENYRKDYPNSENTKSRSIATIKMLLLEWDNDAEREKMHIDYWIIELLFEWHFDVFNLIPQGLALPKKEA